jgi:hypothetical protein
VSNGTVRGMGGFGIELVGNACQLIDMLVTGNGGNGIQAYCTGQVIHTIARGNGDNGIHLVQGVISDSQSIGNGSSGFYMTGSVLLLRSASLSNGGPGVTNLTDGSLVGNTIIGNTGAGITVTAGTGYGQNVISGNATPQISGGVQMGGNVCNGAAC